MNVFDILKKVNYYIKYKYYTKNNTAIISLSLDEDPFDMVFRYDNKSQTLFISNGSNDRAISCKSSVAPLIVKSYLYRLAKMRDYPVRYIMYHIDDNVTTRGFIFGDYDKLNKDFVYLLWDVFDHGLTDEHILIAKDEKIWDEMKSFISGIWPINIVDQENEKKA